MKKLELKENIWWIGAIDHNLRVFDIIMYTEFGTTYNSYLIKGSEKTALVETVKYTFTEEYLEKLAQEVDLTKIDYIIVDHTEPDHAGTVAHILEKSPGAVVVGSEPAIRFMKNIANREFESMVVGDGDSLSLGDKTLRFISAPFLHWPDSIYTYVVEDKVLFTCDSFGAHYALDDILYSKLDNVGNYRKALKYYFDMIFGPFKKYMLQAIDKIKDLEIDMVCNGHGPVLDENPWEIIEQSRLWSLEEEVEGTHVAIPYVSAYSYTKQLALKMEEGLKQAGDIQVHLHDLVCAKEGDVFADIHKSKGLLFGSPTINGDALLPIMEILVKLSPIVHGGKLASAFGSYGWSGEAVDNIERRLKELRMEVVPGFKVNFKPSEAALEDAVAFGRTFGEYVLGTKTYEELVPEDQDEEDFVYDGTIRKWRCVVCGEVFEGPLPPAICPACGATREQFEEYVDETVSFRSEDPLRILIIGNGAAGIATADAIRKRNGAATVTIIDEEPSAVYYKPLLSEYLANDAKEEDLFLHGQDWYDELGIELRTGCQVASIDPQAQEAVLCDGERLPYDRLVLAAGARSFVPPIKNAQLPGVFTLRSLQNANAMKEYLAHSRKVVIVGGGLIGLEAASEIRKNGLEVTVVEIAERLLPRQLDEQGARIFEQAIVDTGIAMVKGASVVEILGSDKVEGVRLSTGDTLEADFVLVSAGVKPETTLAASAGIRCERGVVVDLQMRTNVPNIYAAGDVAVCEGVNYSIWPEAIEQGRVAGSNAVGDHMDYEAYITSNVFNGLGVNIFSVGKVNYESTEGLTQLLFEDPAPGKATYKKLYFVDDKLTGAVIIGDNKKTKKLINGIKHGAGPMAMLSVLKG
ncbi:FAD-dependent oxidoreductase [Anaerotalea alkaliphila]|uniref:FAD-dependent oxidoreductase n=1 Tax=Anaerotalea alkaliphila TaxID=2662126 RepID=A0A7X5HWX7_9FIRM|nr:FAD-dependent oxidoreductase [Anaerotalea alkaliphila]NDL68173.1 FAD-dependent oxidoreductase [Anaerotalea alkaliphila]